MKALEFKTLLYFRETIYAYRFSIKFIEPNEKTETPYLPLPSKRGLKHLTFYTTVRILPPLAGLERQIWKSSLISPVTSNYDKRRWETIIPYS